MPTRTTAWPPGAPCWADNHVPDLEVARRFYRAVFGWEIDDPDPDAGNFACARLDGRPAAGFLVAVPDATPVWHVYFASDDADETAAAIEQNGGTSLFGPHPVGPDRGRFQLAADPAGAVFGVWRAESLTGLGVHDEPGSFGRPELHSSDPAVAKDFYRVVFGTSAPVDAISGLADADESSRWLAYFVVDDLDAALAACTKNGGHVSGEAHKTPCGAAADVVDPFGAAFSIVTARVTA